MIGSREGGVGGEADDNLDMMFLLRKKGEGGKEKSPFYLPFVFQLSSSAQEKALLRSKVVSRKRPSHIH
jgi:hypothetical protein